MIIKIRKKPVEVEMMIFQTNNEDGSPNTAHSLNPVPCVLVSDKYDKINDGILADIAPTILKVLGMDTPVEMTGKSLV